MKMNRKLAACLLALLLAFACPGVALADDWYFDEPGCYTVNTQDGRPLFVFAGQISVDDEYISGDNKRYRVVEVDDGARTAVARFVEDVVLWEGGDDVTVSRVAAPQNGKKVALYCTHTSESYIPGDGAEAKAEKGGILDVANELCEELKKRGVDATVDNTSHVPHDAGAYRRSRSSAMNLMESVRPDLLLDVHRDGVPDAGEYEEKIEGTEASKCRLVVGRGNQNRAANETTAKKLKKIADDTYPGLIKDIYIGKGSYNQDLTPNSLIVELGTHTIEKDKVLKTTGYMADVVAKYLGASGGQNQGGQAQGQAQTAEPQAQQQAQQQPEANRASGRSIAWILGVVGAVGLIFLVVTTARGRRGERLGSFFKELTGGGRHRDRDK